MDTLTQADFDGELDYLGSATRRVFVKGVGFVGVSLLLSMMGGCDKLAEQIKNRPVRRRIRTGSSVVDADIATYRDAVGLMKGLPAADQRRWLAEATIHGTPTGFNMCEHGSIHFFDWHRAYLYYFEKICQKLTNKPKFGLPYWNWNQDPAVPAPFLDSSSTLFASRTRTTMGSNSAVSTSTLDIIFGDTNFFSFSSQLEGTPHNTVHSYIDGTLGQYDSPLDPLFYNHHCMIDYCWFKWNVEMGRQNTNDSTWLNHPNGQFVDANSNPATSTALATILMPLLSYRYESSAIGSNPAQPKTWTASEFKHVEARLRAGAPIRFAVSQRTRLAERIGTFAPRPVALRPQLRTEGFARIVESATASERVFLAVAQANVPQSRDFSVRVFVNLPEATAATPTTDPHFAGSFAFFGNPATEHAHADGAAAQSNVPRFLVDLTHTLRTLRQNQMLTGQEPLTVQLVPTPFDVERPVANAQLELSGIDIITTPVIVTDDGQKER
ncbi:MAG TPA: tyrosinase family protein [Sphingomicrobium sp.]